MIILDDDDDDHNDNDDDKMVDLHGFWFSASVKKATLPLLSHHLA